MVHRRSDAERLLNPLDVLSEVVQASSVPDAWRKFSSRLIRAGFNQPCFFYSDVVPAPGRLVLVRNPDIHRLGTMISEDYMDAVQVDPSLHKFSRSIQRGVRRLEPIVWASDEYLRTHTEAELNVMRRVRYDFQVNGYIGCTFRAAPGNSMYGFMSYNFDAMSSFKKFCDQHTSQFFLATAFAADALNVMRHGENMSHTVLSKRERECLLWIINGKTNQEIGELMSLSDETVKDYVARAMKKLEAKNRAQACARAILLGALKP